jgi:hypothetical protein
LVLVFRVLPVHINTIEAIILDHIHATSSKVLPRRVTRTNGIKRLLLVGVRPAPNAEQHLEIAVLLLEQAELLEGAVDVLSRVGPRVTGEVDVGVSIVVAEGDVAVRRVVSKGVEQVGQLRGGYLLRKVFPSINVLL